MLFDSLMISSKPWDHCGFKVLSVQASCSLPMRHISFLFPQMELHRIETVSPPARGNCRKTFLTIQAPAEPYVSTLSEGPMRSSAQSLPSTAETRGDTCRVPAGQHLNRVSVLTGNSDVESLEHFPSHLPSRVLPQSRSKRFLRRTLIRIITGLVCFVAAIVGTVGGAYFIADVMRGAMFRHSSAHNGTTV